MAYRILGRIRNLVSAREVLRDYMQKQVRERKAALTDTDGQMSSACLYARMKRMESSRWTRTNWSAFHLPNLFLCSVANVLSVPFDRLETYSGSCSLVMVCSFLVASVLGRKLNVLIH